MVLGYLPVSDYILHLSRLQVKDRVLFLIRTSKQELLNPLGGHARKGYESATQNKLSICQFHHAPTKMKVDLMHVVLI